MTLGPNARVMATDSPRRLIVLRHGETAHNAAGIWQGHLREGDAGQAALVEARRLSTDYRQALEALPPEAEKSPSLAPAIHELDRSAAQIRRALARDPDSRLLLEQLRRTYARRLELSQRALVG